jgi:hypothetical protein
LFVCLLFTPADDAQLLSKKRQEERLEQLRERDRALVRALKDVLGPERAPMLKLLREHSVGFKDGAVPVSMYYSDVENVFGAEYVVGLGRREKKEKKKRQTE